MSHVICFVLHGMSGHSKWSQIKRKKEIKDKARGTVFSKLARQITLSVLQGGGIADPENNVKLRLAIEKAKEFNLPKENIERAILKGSGPGREELHEILYEGFGPKKVALLILTATDNPNRTLSEVRNVVERKGGKLAAQGSVTYLFKKCGLVTFKKKIANEGIVFSFSDKLGAFDIDQDGEYFHVYIPFENLARVRKDVLDVEVNYESVEIDYLPLSLVKIESREEVKKIVDLIDALENLDDVQKVFANFD